MIVVKNNLKNKIKVLYVEDNEEARVQTIKLLENYFNNIDVAENGQDGFKMFQENKYHIVFTDLNMPVMDGITMIEEIRKNDKKTPIVVLSAHDDTEYFLKTIHSGIDGYILKPYEFNQINDTINKVLQKVSSERAPSEKIRLNTNFVWDKKNNILLKDGDVIKLTKNEVKLFTLLTTNKHSTFESEDIENYIFNDEISNNRRIRNLMSRLNKKLGTTLVESIYGVGYKIKSF
jgi:DNA-binding response OmpR family regulator